MLVYYQITTEKRSLYERRALGDNLLHQNSYDRRLSDESISCLLGWESGKEGQGGRK